MAAINNSANINGTYGSHQGYNAADNQQQSQQNGSYTSPAYMPNAASGAAPSAGSNGQASEITKDEVGWYFVEQYYTTLSRNPEKLYLFYNKRSQFVSGQEADKDPVCVGQRAINDKIKELDLQDCKVRVTNVDSQSSDSNIVIQVIGEISNRSQPHKKFVQTFVLATQTNGYFVLNDIMRYLVEEEDVADEEETVEREAQVENTEQKDAVAEADAPESGAVAESAEPQGLTSSSDAKAVEKDAQAVVNHIETKLLQSNNVEQGAESGEDQKSTAATPAPTEEAAPAAPVTEASATAVSLQTEQPHEPEPTPAISPVKQAAQPAEPTAAPKSSAPKSWASLAAAANRVATPVTPIQPRAAAPAANAASALKPSSATSASVLNSTSAPSQAPVSAAAATSAPAAASPVATDAPAKRDESPASVQPDEWTAVGGTHARQQSRQVNPQQEGPQNRAYIKNVFESIDAKELRTQLEKYGELAYFDVARAKNCAFVDFKTAEGYNAAIAANPHVFGNERLFVEERHRPRPAGAFNNRGGPMQGGRGGRGGNQNAGRGNFQTNRGGAPGQSRGGRGGGPAAPRGGRGGMPTA